MEEKKWCVYKHTCPNGKVYIGITSNLKQRWSQYGHQYHASRRFFSAICKYGWINIIHEVLMENLTEEEAENKEIELIKKYKSTNPNYGYNICLGGSGVPSGQGFISVDQYDLDGNFIQTFKTINDAARSIGLKDGSTISKMCREESYGHKTVKGYIFTYHGCKPNLIKLTRPNCISVYKIDQDKNIIEKFNSLKDAAKSVNGDASTISKACANQYKNFGYYWCKENEYNEFIPKKSINEKKRINQIDIDGNIINTFLGVKEAAKQTGVSRLTVTDWCIGRRTKSRNGFRFEYASEEL